MNLGAVDPPPAVLDAKHMSRSTHYAAELARAEFAECRIERIFVRETLTEVIRFSDWRGGRYCGQKA